MLSVLVLLVMVMDLNTMVVEASLDLGPLIRVAQCRSHCLKAHSLDGSCEWWRHGETGCSECWQHCEALEKQWSSSGGVNWNLADMLSETSKQPSAECSEIKYKQCPSCKTACEWRRGQVVEEYLPSMLPAPHRDPINLSKNDVAIVLRKSSQVWRVLEYYPGVRSPQSLRQDEWVVAVVEDGGVVHFSTEEWMPTLDSLKEGPLYEATISWRDVNSQLRKQQALEQKRFNDRVRQFFLEKYGEKVLEWRNQDESEQAIPEEVFRRFFFRRRETPSRGGVTSSSSNNGGAQASLQPSTIDSEDERQQSQVAKEAFVVSWEPEAGGLMGNQVADSNFAQISLLPGTKYLVRIASNEGPGSFPIEVDTRPGSPQVRRIPVTGRLLPSSTTSPINVYPWALLAASLSAAICICLVLIVKIVRSSREPKKVDPSTMPSVVVVPTEQVV
ncbi:hypothetical protein QAD02_010329 [Eretmocerus hayati]|uniref:Uncharacterized protein n=1 Tax=Eretmocerus hayati TaxID=131215 RepID=A0ACC2NDD1_9HYME|nr:hypothetical protein QAD02_010329 [Eretmocerus hayati]